MAASRSREIRWASTMEGHALTPLSAGPIRHAHAEGANRLSGVRAAREQREEVEDALVRPGRPASGAQATGTGPGARRHAHRQPSASRPHPALECSAWRARPRCSCIRGPPADALTHALEVAQVATAIARAVGANVALTEAIALGHDCGHGPGGHASEDAFSPYVQEWATTTPCGARRPSWCRSTCAS
ncbi:MAG: HD domain-containing protein [Microthrixaceae bacterium]